MMDEKCQFTTGADHDAQYKLDALLKALSAGGSTNPLFSGRLWTIKDIATYLDCSQRSATRVMSLEHAPEPLRIGTGTGYLPRYVPDAVIRYLHGESEGE